MLSWDVLCGHTKLENPEVGLPSAYDQKIPINALHKTELETYLYF